MKRNISIDLLKILAIVAVITIHISGSIVFGDFSVDFLNWWVGNIFFGISSWAVPVFVMTSGFFLLNPHKNESLKQFFQKRCNRILIPSAFWFVFYSLTKVKAANIEMFSAESFNMVINSIIEGSVFYHLWFVYLIIGLYLLTPILRFLIKNLTQKSLACFLVILFLIVFLLKIMGNMAGFSLFSAMAFYCCFLGYFLLGYFLAVYKLKKYYKPIYVLGIISFLTAVVLTSFVFDNSTVFDNNYFYQAYSITIMLMSLAIFVFFQKLDTSRVINETYIPRRLIIRLSTSSFGVYLIHPYIIYSLESSKFGFSMTPGFITPIVGIPLTIVFTTFISFLCVFIIQKIPFLKRIV